MKFSMAGKNPRIENISNGNMRNKYFISLIILFSAILLSGCVSNNEQSTDTGLEDPIEDDELSTEVDIEERFIPGSFDKYYKIQPSEYLLKMNELSSSMENVVIDLQDGNISSANKSFNIFSMNYNNSSTMVDGWDRYYDTNEIDDLGRAIHSGNISEAFEMMDNVRDACTDCHREIRYVVWAMYDWKDFQDVKMNTTDANKSQVSWITAKTKYLLPGFEGIGIGLREGQKEQTVKSFELFKNMFINMKDACGSCHNTERKYYVNEDVMSMIDAMEKEISTGNPDKAEKIRLEIGSECHKCHIIHEPLQRIRELEE